jgi:hypothetical protein
MAMDIGEWTVRVLDHGLPALPARLERGETVPAAVWQGKRAGGVVFVRLWKNGQPDSEVAIARRAADGSWEVPSWGGGPWIDDPMIRPEDGWDGSPVLWLQHAGQFVQGDTDGVRAQAGAAARRVAAIQVEQAGRTWSVPVDSPCGAFIVVMESLAPARLCAVDERGEAVLERPGVPACMQLDDITDLMREEWWPELPADGKPMIRYDFQPTGDE